MISFVFDLFKSHLNSFDSVPMFRTIAFKNKLLGQPDPKILSILYHFFTSCFLLFAFRSGQAALPVIGAKEVLCCKTITLSEWYDKVMYLITPQAVYFLSSKISILAKDFIQLNNLLISSRSKTIAIHQFHTLTALGQMLSI